MIYLQNMKDLAGKPTEKFTGNFLAGNFTTKVFLIGQKVVKNFLQ